jgi:hypothetical protein
VAYQTIFDLAAAGYKSWTFPAYGLIFVAIGAAMMIFRKHLPLPSRKAAPWILTLALAWTILTYGLTFLEYRSLSSALESGEAKTVTGVVSNFKPMPASGHANERFCVDRTCFENSDFEVSAGFNNTSSQGGPIHEGLPVRVTYFRGKILKLEIAR